MSEFLADPPRWKDHRNQASLAERAAGQGFRSLDPPPPLSSTQVARIAEQISAEPPRPFPWRFCVAAITALLLGGATAASAAYLDLLPRWLTRGPDRATGSPGKTQPHRAKAATVRSRPAEKPATPPPIQDSVSSGQESHASDPGRKTSRAADPKYRAPLAVQMLRPATNGKATEPPTPQIPIFEAPPPKIPPSPSAIAPSGSIQPAEPLAPAALVTPPSPVQPPPERLMALAERAPARSTILPARRMPPDRLATVGPDQSAARHLAEAIRQVRVQHAPKTALGILARHEAELAQHGLVHEVLLVRVEALLLLDRKEEVLRLLDRAQLRGVAAQKSLLLTRGELRAAAGRCPEALGDFDSVLAKSNPADPRALRGRAACAGKPNEAPDKANTKVP